MSSSDEEPVEKRVKCTEAELLQRLDAHDGADTNRELMHLISQAIDAERSDQSAPASDPLAEWVLKQGHKYHTTVRPPPQPRGTAEGASEAVEQETTRSHSSEFCDMAAFLRRTGFPANLSHIRHIVHDLMHKRGARFNNGALCVLDQCEGRWVRLAADSIPESQLHDAVLSVAMHKRNGGQGSSVLTSLLQGVSSHLCSLADEVLEHMKTYSTQEQHTVDGDAVGQSYLVYSGEPNGGVRQWSMQTGHANRGKLDDCAAMPWFLGMALHPSTVSNAVTFDDIKTRAIRSGAHVVQAVALDGGFALALRPYEDEPMLLDAGHDLGSLPICVELDPAMLAAMPEVVEARACMEGYLGEHTDFFLYAVAERLLIKERKHAHVFEASSDRGKSTLFLLIEAGCGTYVERVSNDALQGANKRTVPLQEVAKSRAGVRFLLHDEVDRPDYEYLKQQSNAVAAQEMAVGMQSAVTAEHKATRLLTRNATSWTHKAESAPTDCRRKIVLWGDAALAKPPENEKLFQRIKARDATLARGFFLACMETFQRFGGKSDGEIPTALLCGADLRHERDQSPATVAVGVPVVQSAAFAAYDTVAEAVIAVYHAQYQPSTNNVGGTQVSVIKAAIIGAGGLPTFLSDLSDEAFATHFLRAGHGDVPPMQGRGLVAVPNAKPVRVNKVICAVARVHVHQSTAD